jgi:hypothetical protein
VRWMQQDPDLANVHDDIERVLFQERGPTRFTAFAGFEKGIITDDTIVRNSSPFPITEGVAILMRSGLEKQADELLADPARLSPSDVEILWFDDIGPRDDLRFKNAKVTRTTLPRGIPSTIRCNENRSLNIAPRGARRYMGFCTPQKSDHSESYRSARAWLVLQPIDNVRFSAKLALNPENDKAAERVPQKQLTFDIPAFYDGVTEVAVGDLLVHLRLDEELLFYGWTESAKDREDGVRNAFVMSRLETGR